MSTTQLCRLLSRFTTWPTLFHTFPFFIVFFFSLLSNQPSHSSFFSIKHWPFNHYNYRYLDTRTALYYHFIVQLSDYNWFNIISFIFLNKSFFFLILYAKQRPAHTWSRRILILTIKHTLFSFASPTHCGG